MTKKHKLNNVHNELHVAFKLKKDIEPVPLPRPFTTNVQKAQMPDNLQKELLTPKKINKRCKHFPDCRKGDNCLFRHIELCIDTEITTPNRLIKDLTNVSPKDLIKVSPKDLIKESPKDLIKVSPNLYTNDSPKSMSVSSSPSADNITLTFWKNKADAEEKINEYCTAHIGELRQEKTNLETLLNQLRTHNSELSKYYDEIRSENNILRKKILELEEVNTEYNKLLCSQLSLRPPGL